MMRFKFSPRINPRSALFCRDTIVKGVMVNYGNLIKLLWSSSRDIDIKSNAQSEFNYLVLEVTDGKMKVILYVCLMVVSCCIPIAFQKAIEANDLQSLIDQLVKPLENNNNNITFMTKMPGNNSKIIYFKTVTEPKVIFKRQSSNTEDEQVDKDPDFLYDDAHDNELPNFRRSGNSRNINKIDVVQDLEIKVEEKAAPALKPEGKSPNSSERAKSRSGILPDFVIDQIVYEENESNSNLKSTIVELEKKITSHNDKERHKFSRLFREIKNLYSELQELKKIQEQINKTQEILTRRDNSANERSRNVLNLPTPKACSKTINPNRYPTQHPKHQVNPLLGLMPIINNHPKMLIPPIVPLHLQTIPRRFSTNFNNNQRFVQHTPLLKYFN